MDLKQIFLKDPRVYTKSKYVKFSTSWRPRYHIIDFITKTHGFAICGAWSSFGELFDNIPNGGLLCKRCYKIKS